MVAETEQLKREQFLTRVGSLPVVTSAIGQVLTFYNNTKESNSLVKYALETTESSVKTVANTAMPVVNKFEVPIDTLNKIACDQLDKLEHTYPIITKPTDKVLEETKQYYEVSVKPTVDRVTAVKHYGVDQVTNAKNYTYNKVDDAKNYTYHKVDDVKQYSLTKLNGALQTPYGQVVTSGVDGALDVAERYVDYYLPEDQKEKKETDEKIPAGEATPLSRVVSISGKVRHRMYNRAMRDLQNAKKRSKETLDNLNFTVDLIAYAKTHIDGVQGRLTAAGSKAKQVWEEINKTEEEIEMEEINSANKENKEVAQIGTVTFERRVIATARHLTMKLKHGMKTVSGAVHLLPTTLQTRMADAKKFTEEMYNGFSSAKTFDDLPKSFLDQIRNKMGYLTETLSFATEYVTNTYSSWMGRWKGAPTSQAIEPTPKTNESTEVTDSNKSEEPAPEAKKTTASEISKMPTGSEQ